jgi:mitogen-activated protein kinase 1/3
MRKLMKNGHTIEFSSDHIKYILYNLLCAMNFLASANIVHRDLKPANILMNRNCQIKICDFGLARTLPESIQGQGSGNTKRIRDCIKNPKSFDDTKIKETIRSKLDRSKEQRQKKQRCLSSHVCSRWFRAPEIILVEK